MMLIGNVSFILSNIIYIRKKVLGNFNLDPQPKLQIRFSFLPKNILKLENKQIFTVKISPNTIRHIILKSVNSSLSIYNQIIVVLNLL